MTTGPAHKPDGYYDVDNGWIAERIVGEGLHVLDVGCGSGALVRRLRREKKIGKAYGVECVPEAAAKGRDAFDVLWSQDVETLAPDVPPGTLDAIIFSHVLEHLRDPAGVLMRLLPLLKADGRLLASVPNVSHWRVIWALVARNDWRYEPQGVMDDTHLRWFTSRSVRRLLLDSGYRLLEMHLGIWGPKGRCMDVLTAKVLTRLWARQIDFVACPARRPAGSRREGVPEAHPGVARADGGGGAA